jgi:uncharacterized protein involved in exopolysaccharide biosynthesis
VTGPLATVTVPGLRPQHEVRTLASPLHQVLFVVFKRKRLIAGLCIALTAAAATAMYLKPTTSSATARLLLKPDRMPLQISGLVASSSRLPHSPQILQSEVEMLKSREVLVPVARRRLEAEMAPELPPTPQDLEQEVQELSGRMQPVAVPDTNIIQVTYTAATSKEAVSTLRLIIDQYIEEHGNANSGSHRLLRFYEDEWTRVGASLTAAEESLRAWQERHNVVNVDTEIANILGAMSERQKALRHTDAEIDAGQARLASLERQRQALPERLLATHERIRNPLLNRLQADVSAAEVAVREVERDALVSKLRTDLATAEVGLQDLLQRYTDEDRRVLEKREQVAFIRRELLAAQEAATAAARSRLELLQRELATAEKQTDVVGRQTTELNPVREELDKSVAVAAALRRSLDAQRTVLARQIGEIGRELGILRERKVEAEQRGRDVEQHRNAFSLYGKKLEEARVASGLEKHQLSSVAVVEKPHAEEDQDTRRRLALVLLAGGVGLALGVAAAFGLEFLSTTLKTPGEVEYYLGVPVLAAIPDTGTRALPLPTMALEVKGT